MRKKILALSIPLALVASLILSGCTVVFADASNPVMGAAKIIKEQDDNAKADLANVAYGNEFNLANEGQYAATLDELRANVEAKIAAGGSGPIITLSEGTVVDMTSSPARDSYLIAAKSQSGHVFMRSSKSASATEFDSLEEYNTSASPIADVPLPTLN